MANSNPQAETGQRIRQLGINEQWAWNLNEVSPCNGTLIARVSGPMTEEIARQALDRVHSVQPILQAHIEKIDHELWFVNNKNNNLPIPLRLVANCDEEQLVREINDDINKPIDWRSAPLARVTMLQTDKDTVFLFSRNHSISDGSSGCYLLRDFLRAAENIIAGNSLSLPEKSFSRSIDELIPERHKGLYGKIRVLGDLLERVPNYLKKHPRVKLGPAEKAGGSEVGILRLSFDPYFTEKLRQACKKNNTTVHGALCSAMIKVIYHDIDLAVPANIACMSALSLRKLFEPPVQDDLGLYFSGMETYHRVGCQTDFWKTAREVSRQINRVTERRVVFRGIHFQKKFLKTSRHPANFARRNDQIMRSPISVSNLGVVPIASEYGPFSLKSVEICVVNSAIDRIALILGASTFNGNLILNLTYKTGTKFGQERASRLFSQFEQILQAAVD